jgi:hypothetical protein
LHPESSFKRHDFRKKRTTNNRIGNPYKKPGNPNKKPGKPNKK